jgi:hypothetical protein
MNLKDKREKRGKKKREEIVGDTLLYK